MAAGFVSAMTRGPCQDMFRDSHCDIYQLYHVRLGLPFFALDRDVNPQALLLTHHGYNLPTRLELYHGSLLHRH